MSKPDELLVDAEDALFFGFVLPRKTAVVLGGVLADQGPGLGLLARYDRRARRNRRRHRGGGPLRQPPLRLLITRPLRRHEQRSEKAQDFIRRRGPEAVFLGRFIAFFAQ
ncbi:hypothetical protein [Streptomyces sp. NPDC059753]|uniref:hypothetical protein n=1 Tax=Streptomyces sp. NPDC059753 TaxID=3346933 RepID=UPI00365C1878